MITSLLVLVSTGCTPPVPDDSAGLTDTYTCTLHADADADGYGDPAVVTYVCDLPGYVEDNTDCDDSDPAISPSSDEFCNWVDDDCDGQTDEGDIDDQVWHRDQDIDGYGQDQDTLEQCEPPEGYARHGGDCDDDEPTVHPRANEFCDALDQDCDEIVDEDALDAPTWYLDEDRDDHGTPTEEARSCQQPSGYAALQDDCDDDDDRRFPDNPERCDNVDNDCDETVDEEATDAPTWFLDSDSDGFGDAEEATISCDAPADHVADATDCDDAAASHFPGATEACDGADQDCDLLIDEGVLTTFYLDADSDGYGVETDPVEACDPPTQYVTNATDCNDTDGGIKPGANEGCDGVDEDCDDAIDEDPVDGDTVWKDNDGDGHGDPLISQEACDVPKGWSKTDDDCDDSDSKVSPSTAEVCDSADQDCDTLVDEGALSTFYADLDSDGYGDPANTTEACTLPSSGYVADSMDCYDLNSAASPDQTAFFSTDRGDGSYDWSCDGLEEEELPDAATCGAGTTNPNVCEGSGGWESGVPACGSSASWVERCNGAVESDGSCGGMTSTQTQSCR